MSSRPTHPRNADELLTSFAELSSRSVPPTDPRHRPSGPVLPAIATAVAAVVLVTLVGVLVVGGLQPDGASPATRAPSAVPASPVSTTSSPSPPDSTSGRITVAVTGPSDSGPPEQLVLGLGETAWNGYGGVASVELSGSISVRLVGRDSCRTYVEFTAHAGEQWVIRFAADGSVDVEDWTGRALDSGPALAPRTSACLDAPTPSAPSSSQTPALPTAVEVVERTQNVPIPATVRASTVWTGSELIIWGGWRAAPDYGPAGLSDRGAAYDPAADGWRVLSRAPLSARQWHLAGWTGAEMLVWGGLAANGLAPDGAAYDPASDSWRTLPPAPPGWVARLGDWQDGLGGPSASAWTGTEWVLAFKMPRDDSFEEIVSAAYDPNSETWRELPPAAVSRNDSLSLTWTGSELIAGPFDQLWRLPIDDDAWRPIARLPDDLAISATLWAEDRLIAVLSRWSGGSPESTLASWDPASDKWSSFPPPPRSAHGELLWDGRRVIVIGSGLAYDVPAAAWLEVPLTTSRLDPVLGWTGRELVIWGGWDCDMCPSGVFQAVLVLTPQW